MDRSSMYCYSRVSLVFFTLTCAVHMVMGQGNCQLYSEDSGERKACELSYRAIELRQGSKESQKLFDQAIEVGPKYAWAYYEKSVPFFKRGMLADGVSLINKAIELEPKNYLYYRAYWYFYNRSYELCIQDLEALYTNHQASFTTTPGGELEMRLLLGMAYAHTGQLAKGIDWMQDLMSYYQDQPKLKGFYDHFCLGVLYYQNNQLDLAKAQFKQQLQVDSDFADSYYYLGLIAQQKSNSSATKEYFIKALAKINREQGGYSTNIFTEFNTYKEDIVAQL